MGEGIAGFLNDSGEILHLLYIQGRVSKGQIYLVGCMPICHKQEEMLAYRPFEPDQLP